LSNRTRLELGSRAALAKAVPTLARWLKKVVIFELPSGKVSGKLVRLVGPDATVEWNGKTTTVNLLEARSVLLD